MHSYFISFYFVLFFSVTQSQLIKAEKQIIESRESLSGAERRRKEVETVVTSLKEFHGINNAFCFEFVIYLFMYVSIC